MTETQKLRQLKLWTVEPTTVRGGTGNPQIMHLSDGGLRGEIEIEVKRKSATKVLGKDVDLMTIQTISVADLPEEIRKDLQEVFNKIEKLL